VSAANINLPILGADIDYRGTANAILHTQDLVIMVGNSGVYERDDKIGEYCLATKGKELRSHTRMEMDFELMAATQTVLEQTNIEVPWYEPTRAAGDKTELRVLKDVDEWWTELAARPEVQLDVANELRHQRQGAHHNAAGRSRKIVRRME